MIEGMKEDNVIGYRVWQIKGYELWSPSWSYPWPVKAPATGKVVEPKCPLCERGGTDAGGGIHAGAELSQEVIHYLQMGGRCVSVAGQVVLGGKIAEHYMGFRAEQGYPYCLYYIRWQAYPSKLLVKAAALNFQGGYASEEVVHHTAAAYGCETEPAPPHLVQAVIANLRNSLKQHVQWNRQRPKWDDKTHWGVPGKTMIAFCQELAKVGGSLPQQGCLELIQMFGNYEDLGAWLIIKRCRDRGMVSRKGERGSFTIHLNPEWEQIVEDLKQRGKMK